MLLIEKGAGFLVTKTRWFQPLGHTTSNHCRIVLDHDTGVLLKLITDQQILRSWHFMAYLKNTFGYVLPFLQINLMIPGELH